MTLLNNVDKSILMNPGCYYLFPMFIFMICTNLFAIVPIAISMRKHYDEVAIYKISMGAFILLSASRIWEVLPFLKGVLVENDDCEWLYAYNATNMTNMSHTQTTYENIAKYIIYTDIVFYIFSVVLLVLMILIAVNIERVERLRDRMLDCLKRLRGKNRASGFYQNAHYGSTDTLRSDDSDPDNPRNVGSIYENEGVNPYLTRKSASLHMTLDEDISKSAKELLGLNEHGDDETGIV